MMRVGIAGAGFMAATHITEYADLDVEIAGVASRSGIGQFVHEHGLTCPTYTDVERLVAECDLDFLDICTPTHTHLAVVETAAEAGVDVFLEKPIAGSLSDAAAIVTAAANADVTLMVGHVVRFMEDYRECKARAIGDPGVARARRLSPIPTWGSEDWYANQEKSGGVFVDLAIHDLDFLRWCWGEVRHVFARRHQCAKCEHGFVTLRFANGAVGYVEASWAQPDTRPFTTELELAGSDGLVELSSEAAAPFREWTADDLVVENPVDAHGYRRELQHFIDCLAADEDPAVTGADAVESLRIALAANASAERGEPVTVTEIRP